MTALRPQNLSPKPDDRDDGAPGDGADRSFDEAMMARALDLAREACCMGEVPVGAVIVYRRRVLAQAHNLRETLRESAALTASNATPSAPPWWAAARMGRS